MGQITIALLATGLILAGLIWAICLLVHDQQHHRRQIRAVIHVAEAVRTKKSCSKPSPSSGKPRPRVSVAELLQRAVEQNEPLRLNWAPDQLDSAGRVLHDSENSIPYRNYYQRTALKLVNAKIPTPTNKVSTVYKLDDPSTHQGTLVMTWNLGYSGLDPHVNTDDRFWRQIELINRLAPDILCIQEAWSWDQQGSARLLAFEHATRLRTFLAAPAPSGFHTAIAVRPPMVRPLKHIPHHEMTQHASNTLTVELGAYEIPVAVTSVHLTETDGDTRLRETAQLVDLARNACILAGTLNCAGLNDPPADLAAAAPILQCRYAAPPAPGPDGTVILNQAPVEDRRAMYRLHQATFTDSATARSDLTMPAPATTGYNDSSYLRRHDHILVSPHLASQIIQDSYAILDTEAVRALSPHLPVAVELHFT